MKEQPTPFTVLGGFLGAGKTTLLNRILSEASATRYAVLVNDFGKINIDASLVTQHDGQTLTLSNGCICCSLANGFINTMLSLMERRDEFDHIVVEASGVSEPQRIMDIAKLDPELRADAIVVLVDARNLRKQLNDPALTSVVRSQLLCADLLLLNKVDLIADALLQEIQSCVKSINPRAQIIRCTFAQVPTQIITGGEVTADHACLTKIHDTPITETAVRDSALETSNLQTTSMRLNAISKEEFEQFCDSLSSSVIRGKGLITFKCRSAWWRWQKVADQQSLEYHAPVTEDLAPNDAPSDQGGYGELVLIGTKIPLCEPAYAHFFTEIIEPS